MQRIKVEHIKEYCNKILTIGIYTSHKYYKMDILLYRVRKRQVKKIHIGNPKTMIKANNKNQGATISKHRLSSTKTPKMLYFFETIF